VARLERELPKVVEQAATLAAEAGTPAHQLRVFARALLLGNLRTGHESGPHALVLDRDPAAALLFGANQQAAHVLGQMTAAGLDGDPVARVDAVECRLWSAFMARVRALAEGEDR
jgi:hypothetical protein